MDEYVTRLNIERFLKQLSLDTRFRRYSKTLY
jgi:hypothetical protein